MPQFVFCCYIGLSKYYYVGVAVCQIKSKAALAERELLFSEDKQKDNAVIIYIVHYEIPVT